MSVTISEFGRATDSTPVRAAVLNNGILEAHILSYGAVLHRLYVRDKHGSPVDVVLGYPTVPDYELNAGDAMGAVVGRFANRIGGASFYLYEQEYHVTANQKGNCLHSGLHGFARTVFEMEPVEGDENAVRLTAESPDGTDGFPGNMQLEVQYSLAGSALVIRYYATTDAPTVVNITNHSYFNLNGHASGSALGHRLALESAEYLETDEDSIPTGRRIPVAGTPMDFNEEKNAGARYRRRLPRAFAGQGLRPLLPAAGHRPAPRRLAGRPGDRHPHGDADHPAGGAAVHRQLSGPGDPLQGRRPLCRPRRGLPGNAELPRQPQPPRFPRLHAAAPADLRRDDRLQV